MKNQSGIREMRHRITREGSRCNRVRDAGDMFGPRMDSISPLLIHSHADDNNM